MDKPPFWWHGEEDGKLETGRGASHLGRANRHCCLLPLETRRQILIGRLIPYRASMAWTLGGRGFFSKLSMDSEPNPRRSQATQSPCLLLIFGDKVVLVSPLHQQPATRDMLDTAEMMVTPTITVRGQRFQSSQ